MIESGELEAEHSDLFFFLSSVTDRSEGVDKYLNNGSIPPIYLTQKYFSHWLEPGQTFEPHYLDLFGEKKKIRRERVISSLKHMLWNRIQI